MEGGRNFTTLNDAGFIRAGPGLGDTYVIEMKKSKTKLRLYKRQGIFANWVGWGISNNGKMGGVQLFVKQPRDQKLFRCNKPRVVVGL